jgi:hypothetical protein
LKYFCHFHFQNRHTHEAVIPARNGVRAAVGRKHPDESTSSQMKVAFPKLTATRTVILFMRYPSRLLLAGQ